MDATEFQPGAMTFGRLGGAVTPSDSADLDPIPKAVEVTATGTLEVLPLGNDDGAWVDLGTCDKGYQPPFVVRRVREVSTATVIWIGD